MSTTVTPMWKMRINDCLRRSNKVNLSGEDIEGLDKIGTIKLMVQLDLSYVRTIHSFEGFKHQPALKTFIADGSAISSLKNVSSLSDITAISLKSTPLMKSNQTFNVVASLILCIPNLRIFNGKVISQKTRAKVESAGYPMPQTARLIDAGWIVEYPCPSKQDIIEHLKSFEIFKESDLEEIGTDIEEEEEEINQEKNENDQNEKDENHEEEEEKNPENKNQEINEEQIENSHEYYEYETTDEVDKNEYEYDKENNENNKSPEYDNPFNKPISEMSLLEKVVMVLRNYGYEIDTNNMQQSVLSTIDSLCSEVEQINSSNPSEQSSQV